MVVYGLNFIIKLRYMVIMRLRLGGLYGVLNSCVYVGGIFDNICL